MSPQTGAAIIAREQASMSAERLRAVQASRARSVVTLALSAIQERLTDPAALDEIPLRDLAHAMQRAHEVGAMLAGDPTHRVERVDATRPDDAARDYLASLPAADVRVSPPAESIRTGEKGDDRESGQAACGAAGCEREAPGEDVEGARVDGSAGAFGDSESPAANAQKAMGTGARDDVAGESYAQSYAVGGAGAGPAVSVGAGGRSVEGAR